jgi:6-phosphofructokinase 1
MNAAIRAVVRSGIGRGCSVFGVQHGFDGLLDADYREMDSATVGNIISAGGTILRSARSERFLQPEYRKDAAERMRASRLDGLIIIGGDGSIAGGEDFAREQAVPVIAIPASIDNDIPMTDASIGFQTAVNTALDAIDKVRDTAYSHDRVFVIEVMGRRNGFIAVEAGLAGGAEAILIPELPFNLGEVCDRLLAGQTRGKRSSIIVTAEGAARALDVCEFISRQTGHEARYLVLGHMQRGGKPSAYDRVLATQFGAAAVRRLAEGAGAEMVCIQGGRIGSVPLDAVRAAKREIDSEKLILAEVMSQ